MHQYWCPWKLCQLLINRSICGTIREPPLADGRAVALKKHSVLSVVLPKCQAVEAELETELSVEDRPAPWFGKSHNNWWVAAFLAVGLFVKTV